MANLQNIEAVLQVKLQKSLSSLPTVLGNEAVMWTKQNFKRQGFPGATFTPWKQKEKDDGRRVLYGKTGRLSRSPRLITTYPLKAIIGSDVPYAAAHNNGFRGLVNVPPHKRNKFGTTRFSTGKSGKFRTGKTITGTVTVKAYQRFMNLPRRRFMGYSPILKSILQRKAIVHIGRELKN